MITASLLLLAPFLFPIWRIVLEAPQYPTPLGMDIHITKIVDMNPNDVKNINLMNHYVGMKNIPAHLPELDIFPVVIGFMAALGFLIGLKGNWKLFFAWFIVMSLLGCAGMYDFYLWEHDYGHTLDPKAIIKFTNPDGTPMGYQPPLIGTKRILNFTVHSYPRLGGVLVMLSVAVSSIAALVARKAEANS